MSIDSSLELRGAHCIYEARLVPLIEAQVLILTVIQGNTNLLQTGCSSEEEHASTLRKINLPTVFGIVEQHHGWIDVQSQVNVGTTFHIYLPTHEADVPSPPSSPEPPPPGGRETILLVEDETRPAPQE